MKSTKPSNKPSDENNRKALEEAINYYKHIDNFFWVISSFLMGLSVTSLYYLNDKIEEVTYVLIFYDIIMILVWCWYIQFYNDCTIKIKYYYNRIKEIEMQLEILIVPVVDDSLEIEIMNGDKRSKFHKLFKASSFHKIMKRISILFIIVFLYKLITNFLLVWKDFMLQIRDNNGIITL